MKTLKFSPANAKIKALENVDSVNHFLMGGKRKVYSFDLISGHTCPYAKNCLSKVIELPDGSRKLQDGVFTEFRCFSASQEIIFKNVYNLRKHNTDAILPVAAESVRKAADLILDNMPSDAGIIRLHVGGDFKTRNYFLAWIEVARRKLDILFYAYTKSIIFTLDYFPGKPSELYNFRLTASRGGYHDDYIRAHNLRESVVVKSVEEAKERELEIDHDDSHAARSSNQSFALLIHGIQPAGSDWGKAVKKLKGLGSYSRKGGKDKVLT